MNIDAEKEAFSNGYCNDHTRQITLRMPHALNLWVKVKASQTGLKESEIVLLCLTQGAMANSDLKLHDHVKALKISKKLKKKRKTWVAYNQSALRTLDIISAHLYGDTKEWVSALWERYEKENA